MLTNTWLRGQKTFCAGWKEQLLFRGRCKKVRQLLTKLAEPSPRALCAALVVALSGATGDRREFRRLDGTASARLLTLVTM